MRKIISLIITISLVLSFTAGCSQQAASTGGTTQGQAEPAQIVLKIGATPVPHAEILDFVKPLLEKENIKLEIVVFQDYVQPNTALADKELDANFFQHKPYLDNFIKERNLDLVPLGNVHIEPLGLYSKSIKNLSELKEGSTIAIPNDATNAARALLLLQANGLIKLIDGVGIEATEKDIAENPKDIKIQPAEAAQLPRILEDVEAAVINTNYALPANLNPAKDALLIEGKDSPYANLVAVRKGDETRPEIQKLIEILQSDEVKKFIQDKYDGAIVPAF
ncbi:MAG TPA: MetQ/NlpA family ABC transporter substrate-binding protein [Clostridia bacterium]|nr:MetQ/NlpA family ABC transporter substrate-binding protein [Clostridia bacterium]